MRSPKVLILFAGFAKTGVVDETDLALLRELSRHGEVHALYDNDDLQYDPRIEIGSISAISHRGLDFGSWGILIRRPDINLSSYDYILLVNNSILLTGNLDDYLDKAYAAGVDLYASTAVDEHFPGPAIPIDKYLAFNDPLINSFMFVSSFWVLSNKFVRSEVFSRFFDKEFLDIDRSRNEVAAVFERGITRSFWRHPGFKFGVAQPLIFPYSSIYTFDAFRIVDSGVPFIKKKALSEEFYTIPQFEERLSRMLRNVDEEYGAIISRFVNDLGKGRR